MSRMKFIRVLNIKACALPARIDSKSIRYVSNTGCNNYLNNQSVLVDDDEIKKPKIFMKNSNHVSQEILYARKVFGNSKIYSESLAMPVSQEENLQIPEENHLRQQNWTIMNNTELLQNFELLCRCASRNNETIHHSKYQRILDILINQCSQFSTKELNNFLSCLEICLVPNNNMFNTDLLYALDNECLKRMSNWNIDEIFLMNNHFCKLRLEKITRFPEKSLKIMDPSEMTPYNLVKFAYFLIINNKTKVDLKILECCVQKNIDKFDIDEIAIVALAFFRNEFYINETTYFKLIQKLCENIANIHNIPLAAILKILRFSNKLTAEKQLNLLFYSLESQISRSDLTLSTLTHITHLKTKTLIYNESLMSKILERFTKEIDQARLKDIEKIIFSLFTFDYDPQTTPFYTLANNELLNPTRASEIEMYPKSLVHAVLFMFESNFYPEDLLKRIMEPQFVNQLRKNKRFDREYLFMDYIIELQHPEYNGPRIKKCTRNSLQKDYQKEIENQKLSILNKSESFKTEIIHTVKEVFGEKSIYLDVLLPHFAKKEIIMCYDPEIKKFISPTEKLSLISKGSIKYAPNDGKEWLVLIVGVQNLFIKPTAQPIGILSEELRHLRLIGYKPILITYMAWKKLNKIAKKKHIEDLLLSR